MFRGTPCNYTGLPKKYEKNKKICFCTEKISVQLHETINIRTKTKLIPYSRLIFLATPVYVLIVNLSKIFVS